nr:penicillin-binding protein 1C [Cytophagales bacterium]
MWKRLNNRKIRISSLLLLAGFLLYLAIPPGAIFQPDYSTLIKAENGEILHAFLNSREQWHFPPEEKEVNTKLKIAVLTFEDEGYYRHLGVDLPAMGRAIYQNVLAGKTVRGASTIAMQVARMSRPKSRTYINKILEALFAIKLSIHYSKDGLFRLYVDHAPYGGNVVGYQTAARMFFGKEAQELTWSEAATLAVLPNAPGLIYPSKTSNALKDKRDRLLLKLHQKGLINAQEAELAQLETVPDGLIRSTSQAPHVAQLLKSQFPDQDILQTTLDESLQRRVNLLTARYARRLAPFGIHNLAVLITDTESGAVRAYVGSPDFFDTQHGGQVNGVTASRSSGSILKPVLYALSMDEGLITPDSYIRDLPTYFDGFSPKNANREYQGVATAQDALIQSLNIPAVRLLNSYGLYQFYGFLKAAGVGSLFRSADDYGLPLILGGAEVSLWDMVSLYRGLANEGMFSSNFLIQGEKPTTGSRLISPGSCFLTLEMLKELKRPGSEYFWERFTGARNFAWKTGTSYGHKDAWAIGVNPDVTIAVWVGNFNGESNKNLSGASTAGPLLFEILQTFPNSETWFEKKEIHFKDQSICSLSGFRATEACPASTIKQVPYGMKPLKTCEYHQFRYFSRDHAHQTCSRCWDGPGHIREATTVYPPDIAYYLRLKGQYIAPLVSHFPTCPAYQAEHTLSIIYPNLGANVFLPRDFDGKTQAVLCRVGHNQFEESVYWYLDDHFLGTTRENHSLPVHFKEGWNTLKVIDAQGGQDSKQVFAAVAN